MRPQSILDEPFSINPPCVPVRQPIGTFYLASIDAKTLCEITYADVRRMYGEREFESYLGIQRELDPRRVKQLQQYVTTVDACFPTAVILAVDAQCASFDESKNILTLMNANVPDDPRRNVSRIEIAKVLDGQHRIEGLRDVMGTFDVNVSVFIGMDIENQAYLFSTVNLAQTKVKKSLVYDLYDYARARSPQKTAHNIAVALDKTPNSPFLSGSNVSASPQRAGSMNE